MWQIYLFWFTGERSVARLVPMIDSHMVQYVDRSESCIKIVPNRRDFLLVTSTGWLNRGMHRSIELNVFRKSLCVCAA